jgi:hypothetical protein
MVKPNKNLIMCLLVSFSILISVFPIYAADTPAFLINGKENPDPITIVQGQEGHIYAYYCINRNGDFYIDAANDVNLEMSIMSGVKYYESHFGHGAKKFTIPSTLLPGSYWISFVVDGGFQKFVHLIVKPNSAVAGYFQHMVPGIEENCGQYNLPKPKILNQGQDYNQSIVVAAGQGDLADYNSGNTSYGTVNYQIYNYTGNGVNDPSFIWTTVNNTTTLKIVNTDIQIIKSGVLTLNYNNGLRTIGTELSINTTNIPPGVYFAQFHYNGIRYITKCDGWIMLWIR